MIKATFNAWLADSCVFPEASSLTFMVIVVRNRYAQEWLTYRLHPVITRALAYITDYGVEAYFVPKNNAKGIAMNPLEDRLQEHDLTCDDTSPLSTSPSQFDDEQEIAPIFKHSASLEKLLTRVGVAPINPIELPANTTSESVNNRLTEGDAPMTNQSNPTLVRIHSHITQSHFLHVEDSLGIGKVRLFAVNYR